MKDMMKERMVFRKLQCHKTRARLWAKEKDALSETEDAAVAQHLRSCSSCRKEAQRTAAAVRLLQNLKTASVPDSQTDWHELQGRLATLPSAQASVPITRSKTKFALAFCAALLLIAGVRASFSPMRKPLPSSQSPQQAASNVITPDSAMLLVPPSSPVSIPQEKTVRVLKPRSAVRQIADLSRSAIVRPILRRSRVRIRRPFHPVEKRSRQTKTTASETPQVLAQATEVPDPQRLRIALNVDGETIMAAVTFAKYVLPTVQTVREAGDVPQMYVVAAIPAAPNADTTETPSEELTPW